MTTASVIVARSAYATTTEARCSTKKVAANAAASTVWITYAQRRGGRSAVTSTPWVTAGSSKPPTPSTSPVKRPCISKPRPTRCSQNEGSASVMPIPASTAPAAPIARPIATQTKLGGTRRRVAAMRRAANPTRTASSASHEICAASHCSNQAKTTDATGAARATIICQAAGGPVPVRRGMKVKRNPTAKQVRKPSTCAIGWNAARYPIASIIGRYRRDAPSENNSHGRTPAHASSVPSGNSRRYGSRRHAGAAASSGDGAAKRSGGVAIYATTASFAPASTGCPSCA